MVIILNHGKDVNLYNNKSFINLKSSCQIKELKEATYTVILLNVGVNQDGIIEELSIFFEEIIISLEIVAVITNTPNEKLREICQFHNISLLEI